MSRWISQEAERLAPYTPGEQPQDQQYVKLNTNESPFPPSPKVLKAINRAEILKLNLYSDPTCAALTEAIARRYEELVRDAQTQTVGIAHADCAPDAQILASLLRRSSCPPKQILLVDYEPVTGSHVGPGTVALFFPGIEK